MTDDLYRKDALTHRNRSLFGDIILKAPPALWWTTVLIIIVCGVLAFILFGLTIEQDGARMSLYQWLTRHA